ncbi:YIP1 family protein [Natranaerofaba carboxydovora]|uniref:YIP1 family protein n=1 Tax=Natranaerofaba carboxydovora TaxID=2742683 RepID=UPI001F14538C|nr:YIP1 family protein [Natranaerofaba carboxydovora]UMZ74607.1 Yip1 domain protein [Natranaerofaba carboxydovora]
MTSAYQLREAAFVTENVKAELRERKYYFKLGHYIAAITGIIFGVSSYFATNELLSPDLGTNLFAFAALVVAFYFVAKFSQIILGFVLWVVAKMFHYKIPIAQIVRSINFAFLPLWLAAPIVPFITVAPNPITGPVLYIINIFLVIIMIWFIRSLIHVMDAILSTNIHQAIVITGVSCSLILTFILVFT